MYTIIQSMKIKPCPFCGGEASLKMGDGVFDDKHPYTFIECQDCHCRTVTKQTGYYFVIDKEVTLREAINETIDKWNRRLDYSQSAGKAVME